jgi:metal-responsive CopG/Arc/MetJ family transcriptional regulator
MTEEAYEYVAQDKKATKVRVTVTIDPALLGKLHEARASLPKPPSTSAFVESAVRAYLSQQEEEST